ncbi:hypothetical protein [Phenylobacterium sp. CCH9-H3]|uniref:hypothetical protein n=1 Tax=Phenylobacterium sp. CCH9-H3 TaxID=1768774 RepID=UPI00083B2093|nr:hypothetical protein [Phenylobacterium sp. CCH9-H3]
MPSREEAMLGQLAELDLAAAEKVHARLMAAEDADEIDRFGRTYHRLTRSLRQTLALKARLAREREIHRIRTTPLAMTPREASRRHLTHPVRAHIDKAAAAALRFVEREREAPDYDGEYDFLGRTEIYEILEDLAPGARFPRNPRRQPDRRRHRLPQGADRRRRGRSVPAIGAAARPGCAELGLNDLQLTG